MTFDPDRASGGGERLPEATPDASVTVLLWNHGPLRLPVAFEPVPTSTPPPRSSERDRGASEATPIRRPTRVRAVGASLAALGLLSWLLGRERTPW